MSYHDPDIDRLIGLYLSHRATESEKQALEEWLQASAANREVFVRLKKIWSMPSQEMYHASMDQVRDQIWATGTQQQTLRPQPLPPRVNVFYWSKVAATFLLLLLGTWLFSTLVRNYEATFPDTIALVERVNPAGQRSSHRLPDGTKVWLNAESSLRYPEKFSDTLRLVHLSGEAFFEVAKDRQRPFIVAAAHTRTQALGTVFNIQAYPEDDIIKIALKEGKVKVQDVVQHQTAILSPGEEVLVYKDKVNLSLRPFHYDKTFGWKEGILIFDGADFDSFRSTIEKWYGITVEVKGTPSDDWHIRARYQQEDLNHVLRDICFNKNITFELQDKNVLITF